MKNLLKKLILTFIIFMISSIGLNKVICADLGDWILDASDYHVVVDTYQPHLDVYPRTRIIKFNRPPLKLGYKENLFQFFPETRKKI
ncbi:MAG: hypothetical protein LBS28_01665 [Streptococcaceae bacterium]|jgi:hypothetical protein|nr:hypothetical protein [Streptococcaceae bacterium]